MNITNSLIGKGIEFPCKPTASKGVSTSESIDRINQSLLILFSTIKGSRLMMPEFGSDIFQYRFEPLDSVLISRLRETVKQDIKDWEPRIRVESIEFYGDKQTTENNILYISVDYRVINTDVVGNFVYPYQREIYGIVKEII